jgi:hypothetical protein
MVVDPALPNGIGLIELLDIPGRWGRVDAYGRERADVSSAPRLGRELVPQPYREGRRQS